jgi:hypothetical protein
MSHGEEPTIARTRRAVTTKGKRAAGVVLDRVGARAADALHDELLVSRAEVASLRDELARTRAELTAEIELLRAEVAGR